MSCFGFRSFKKLCKLKIHIDFGKMRPDLLARGLNSVLTATAAATTMRTIITCIPKWHVKEKKQTTTSTIPIYTSQHKD